MLSELGPEIWAQVFSFCGEKDDQGLFVTQPTLAACLRVNKAWYLLASPHLYHSPMIRDIGAFLQGAGRFVPQELLQSFSESTSSSQQLYLDCIKQGNTKLPSLHQINQLRIYPYGVADRVDDEWSNDMNRQYGMIENARTILNSDSFASPSSSSSSGKKVKTKNEISLTPRLKSIIVGSHVLPTGLRERTMSDLLFQSIRRLSGALYTRLKPRYWCEFDPPSGHASLDSQEVLDAHLPEYVEFHTTLEEPPCIQWGTTNRITIRDKPDVRKYLWPTITFDKLKNQDTPENDGGDSDTNGHANANAYVARFGKGLNGEWPFEAVSDMDQECWVECIYEMIRDSIPEWSHNEEAEEEKIREKIDPRTVVEVYGIEKFLTIADGYPGGPSYIDEDTPVESKVPEGEVDLNCWRDLKNARFTPEVLAQRNEIYKSIFKHMERAIKEMLDIDIDIHTDSHTEENGNKWKESGRPAPAIRLFLAMDYPGCMACGQGKADRWIVDERPRPPPRDDDSDWTDDDDDYDDGSDMDEEDWDDYELEDVIDLVDDDDDVDTFDDDDDEVAFE